MATIIVPPPMAVLAITPPLSVAQKRYYIAIPMFASSSPDQHRATPIPSSYRRQHCHHT